MMRIRVSDADLFPMPRSHRSDLPIWVSLLMIFSVVVLVIVPMAFMGIPDGYDLMQHIRFAVTYHDAILSGEIIPRWAAEDNDGFGSIGIRYYPPVAYYVLALTRLVSGSWYDSFWLTSFGWMLLGCFGIYRWVRDWASRWEATVAAIIYALVPYHTFQIYQAVLYAEFAAVGILPFSFVYLARICRHRRWMDAALFAVSYSLLILTHIPTTIIASICLAFYGILIMDWKEFRQTAVNIVFAGIVCLLATSFHLSKLVTEIGWVMHNSPQYFSKGYYDYKATFFPMFFSASPGDYVQKVLWPLDALILLTAILFVPAVILIIRNRAGFGSGTDRRLIDRSVILTGIFSIFMLTTLSLPLWNSLTFLQKIQFPWRWLSVASLFASVAFAMTAGRVAASAPRFRRVSAYALLSLVLLMTFFDISQNILPSTPLERSIFDEKVLNMSDEEGCECWWPIWAKADAFGQRELASAEARPVDVIKWTSTEREITVGEGKPGTLRLATFYHPYWQAEVNGHDWQVDPDINGALAVRVPEVGSHIKFKFVEPRFVGITIVVSLIAWMILFLFIAWHLLWKYKQRN